MLLFIIFVLFVASLAKSVGVGDSYAKILLKVFEFGRKKIENAAKRKEKQKNDEEDSEDSVTDASVERSGSVISREIKLHPEFSLDENEEDDDLVEKYNFTCKEFHFQDVLDYVRGGMEAIIEDEVTKCFAAEELPAWNLLTRTNKNYQFISIRLTLIWCVGFFLRYCVLLPIRVCITAFTVGCLIVSTAVIGCFPEGRFKRWLYWHTSIWCFRMFSRAASTIVTYHNEENRAKGGGICVANHTSPIDIMILARDNCYALVGQSHGGFLGILQKALSRATAHIWFERSEVKDREFVARKLSEHVQDSNKLPILVFPEGTCINNTSVMMFKKGSFEIGGTVYPAAIKYDKKFGDPFWNSSKQSYMQYLIMMLTSWAMYCDVWYLPPMTREPNESAVDFSNRVKSEIARKGGLVDLRWDGQLKRMKVKPEWIEVQQKEFSRRIKVQDPPPPSIIQT